MTLKLVILDLLGKLLGVRLVVDGLPYGRANLRGDSLMRSGSSCSG